MYLPTSRSQTAMFSFFEMLVSNVDLAVKKVKVNPGSSFARTIMDWSPRCYKSSFVEIIPLVPEKIFEKFLP